MRLSQREMSKIVIWYNEYSSTNPTHTSDIKLVQKIKIEMGLCKKLGIKATVTK